MSATAAIAIPAWIEPPVRTPKRQMAVHVRTEAGYLHQWRAAYASSFDAYDDALSRYPFAARIEVRPVEPSKKVAAKAAAATQATTGETDE